MNKNQNKKPTHYFVYVGHGTQTKNKLQKEFNDYLENLSGVLVNANSLSHLKQQIIARSKELNITHKRCAPLNISFSKKHGNDGYMISGFCFLTFDLLNAYHHE